MLTLGRGLVPSTLTTLPVLVQSLRSPTAHMTLTLPTAPTLRMPVCSAMAFVSFMFTTYKLKIQNSYRELILLPG